MAGHMFRFILIRVTGPTTDGRAIAIIRSITGRFSSAASGIMVRSTIVTTEEAAIIGMAGAGIAALCMRAQDCAETSLTDTAHIAAIMGPDVVWGADGVKARSHPFHKPPLQ
jgi:hypothetical protein